jgi:cell division control protein 24
LFERILLCCKEVGKEKKQGKAMSMAKPKPGKKRTSLQLKGRIFMQNVTDVVSMARGGISIHSPKDRESGINISF